MRDSRRKVTNRLELLQMPELLLHAPAIGDVPAHHDGAANLIVLVAKGDRPHVAPATHSVRGVQPQFPLRRRLAGQGNRGWQLGLSDIGLVEPPDHAEGVPFICRQGQQFRSQQRPGGIVGQLHAARGVEQLAAPAVLFHRTAKLVRTRVGGRPGDQPAVQLIVDAVDLPANRFAILQRRQGAVPASILPRHAIRLKLKQEGPARDRKVTNQPALELKRLIFLRGRQPDGLKPPGILRGEQPGPRGEQTALEFRLVAEPFVHHHQLTVVIDHANQLRNQIDELAVPTPLFGRRPGNALLGVCGEHPHVWGTFVGWVGNQLFAAPTLGRG